MKHQGVAWATALAKPHKSVDDVFARGFHDRVVVVICEDEHVLLPKSPLAFQKIFHVLDVVDAALQFVGGSKVVNSNQESTLPATWLMERSCSRGPISSWRSTISRCSTIRWCAIRLCRSSERGLGWSTKGSGSTEGRGSGSTVLARRRILGGRRSAVLSWGGVLPGRGGTILAWRRGTVLRRRSPVLARRRILPRRWCAVGWSAMLGRGSTISWCSVWLCRWCSVLRRLPWRSAPTEICHGV
mmetsp:Transcript_28818/g.66591  ORF Transcript_28818/g.66591 Transcript_28818/m.66591 type:complete len:243 (-) Transcript_28818:7-735(-)